MVLRLVMVMVIVAVCLLVQQSHSHEYFFQPWIPIIEFNLVLNKIEKCSSSSAGAVIRTVAHHLGFKQDVEISGFADDSEPFIKLCKTMVQLVGVNTSSLDALQKNATKEWHHQLQEPMVFATHHAALAWSSVLEYNQVSHGAALKLPSFLAAWVRDPMSRCYSAYYYFSVRKKGNDTSSKRLAYLRNCANYEARRLQRLTKINRNEVRKAQDFLYQSDEARKLAHKMLKSYHFVGITERFDESLIVLKNLLNVNFDAVMALPSKIQRSTHSVQTTERNKDIAKFLRKDFRDTNAVDYAIYAVANRQLDSLIKSIPNFDRQLQYYHDTKAYVLKTCLKRNPTHRCECLYRDNGCCFACVSKASRKYRHQTQRNRRHNMTS